MGIWAKIGLTVLVVFIGAIVYGVIRDLVGKGHYIATGVEILILFYIWSRPSKSSSSND